MLSFARRAKTLSLSALRLPIIRSLIVKRYASSSAIIMMHRFSHGDLGVMGDSPKALALALEDLRRAGVRLTSVDQLVEEQKRPHGCRPAGPSIAFTVDDGYRDFMEVALPVFAEFDCPATVFVVPNVVDELDWFWWDKLDYMLPKKSFSFHISTVLGPQTLSWNTPQERKQSLHRFGVYLKLLPNDDRLAIINRLLMFSETELPSTIPSKYRSLSWDEMRDIERGGTRFGAHTLSHPILSRCSDISSENEIVGSIRQLQAQLAEPSALFCYPNGLARDFGEREIDILKRCGMAGALAAEPGLVTSQQLASTTDFYWRIPRFSFDSRRGATIRTIIPE